MGEQQSRLELTERLQAQVQMLQAAQAEMEENKRLRDSVLSREAKLARASSHTRMSSRRWIARPASSTVPSLIRSSRSSRPRALAAEIWFHGTVAALC